MTAGNDRRRSKPGRSPACSSATGSRRPSEARETPGRLSAPAPDPPRTPPGPAPQLSSPRAIHALPFRAAGGGDLPDAAEARPASARGTRARRGALLGHALEQRRAADLDVGGRAVGSSRARLGRTFRPADSLRPPAPREGLLGGRLRRAGTWQCSGQVFVAPGL